MWWEEREMIPWIITNENTNKIEVVEVYDEKMNIMRINVKEKICKCGHPKTWHKVDGVCIRTERHGSMGAVASCNCEKYREAHEGGKQ